MSVKLLTSGGGGVVLTPLSTIASDQTMYLPVSGVSGGTVVCSDSNGNVGIGTSSPASKLHLYGADPRIRFENPSWSKTYYIGSDQNNLVFVDASSNAERMRLDSSGNLLVGTTSTIANERLHIVGSVNNICVRVENASSSSPEGYSIQYTGSPSSPGVFYYAYNAGAKFFISGTGVVNSTSTSITAISDQRHKENVRNLETGLVEIMALKPRRFDWIEGKGTGKKNVAGFIAQEVETVFPDLIGEWKEEKNSEIVYKSIAMGDMLPTIVKAMQEQQTIIESLTERIAALEAQ